MSRIPSKKAYLSAVAKKLNSPVTRRLLMFGQTFRKNVQPLRDELGLAQTQKNILTVAGNQYDITAGKVAFDHQFSNFSEGATYEDISDVRTVGAIDLTILNYATSLIPFICMDRALEATDATIYFNNLVATNNAGGVKAGEVVWGNFNPPNKKVNLSAGSDMIFDAGVSTEYTVDKPVIFNQTRVEYKQGGEIVAVGIPNGDAASFSIVNGVTKSGIAADNLPTITFADGKFTVTAATTPKTGAEAIMCSLHYCCNPSDDVSDAATDELGNVLKIEPQWTALPLKSVPMNIILQNNIANMMYMNKVNAMATGKAGNPYADAIFQRVRNVYIEQINTMILRAMLNNVTGIDVTVDASSYTIGGGAAFGSFVGTKNDLIAQCVTNMKAALLAKTGCGMTAIVANSIAVAMMELVPTLFVKNPLINNGINGLVGYFMDIPVFRHSSLDGLSKTFGDQSIQATDAVMFGTYRNPDNTTGSQVYGEFLPFTATGNVGNYSMPIQNATGFFSQVAHKVVDPNLIVLGTISGNKGIYNFGQRIKDMYGSLAEESSSSSGSASSN